MSQLKNNQGKGAAQKSCIIFLALKGRKIPAYAHSLQRAIRLFLSHRSTSFVFF